MQTATSSATDPGTGQVVVTANGVTGTAPITVLADATAPVAQTAARHPAG